jgi:hypothetical protein
MSSERSLACGERLRGGTRRTLYELPWLSRDAIRVTTGKIHMPSTINLHQIGVWFCVGFFTGAGWALAAWLVGRIFSHI